MAHPIPHPLGLLVLALAAGSSPVAAAVHHHPVHPSAPHRHATHHRDRTIHHPAKPSRRDHMPVAHHDAAPSGVTRVPGGGIKLYCAARANPLLIRKSTQGSGTTVTVVCR